MKIARTTSALLIALLASAIVVAGCGGSGGSSATVNPNSAEVNPAGDIPDNQAYVPYSPSGGGFSVKVPEGWSRTGSGPDTTFTDKLNSIQIQYSAAGAAPTVAQARTQLVPALASSVPGYQAGSVSAVTRQSGSGVLITYLATGKPDPVTGVASQDAVERYLFAGGGKLVTLTLSGPKGADNVDPWRIVTDSLRFGA